MKIKGLRCVYQRNCSRKNSHVPQLLDVMHSQYHSERRRAISCYQNQSQADAYTLRDKYLQSQRLYLYDNREYISKVQENLQAYQRELAHKRQQEKSQFAIRVKNQISRADTNSLRILLRKQVQQQKGIQILPDGRIIGQNVPQQLRQKMPGYSIYQQRSLFNQTSMAISGQQKEVMDINRQFQTLRKSLFRLKKDTSQAEFNRLVCLLTFNQRHRIQQAKMNKGQLNRRYSIFQRQLDQKNSYKQRVRLKQKKNSSCQDSKFSTTLTNCSSRAASSKAIQNAKSGIACANSLRSRAASIKLIYKMK